MITSPKYPYTQLIFTACDRHYFERHAEAFIASIDIHSPGQLLILCVFGTNDAITQQLDDIRRLAKSTEIILYEADECPDSLNKKSRRGYYVVQRFIEFQKVFEHYGIDAIFTDIDNLVLKDLHILSNQYRHADIAIHTRFKRKLESRKVLGALIWFRHNKCTGRLLRGFTHSLNKYAWYQDQALLYRSIIQMPSLKLAHLDKRYVDWDFEPASSIWSAKGDRKDSNELLNHKEQEILSQFRSRKTIAILAPRVDLGFKQKTSTRINVMRKRLHDPVRIYWQFFPKMVRDALQSSGYTAELICLPLFKINLEFIKSLPHDCIYVPHKSAGQIPDKRCHFYMQELYPFFFTLDSRGWAASASYYGEKSLIERCDTGQAEMLIEDIKSQGITKISQKAAEITSWPFEVFFPLQIPHDETIRYHSEYSFDEVLNAVLNWAETSKTRVLLKLHPLSSPGLMARLFARKSRYYKFVTKGHIHAYIKASKAVFVINSGVGFEAILHEKPVITFGRAIYDLICIKSKPNNHDIQNAYEAAIMRKQPALEYLFFIQNYLFNKGCLLNTEQFKMNLHNNMQVEYKNQYLSDIGLMAETKATELIDIPSISKVKRFNSIMKLMNKALPDQLNLDLFEGKSIALVGNGRCLLNREWGSEIDSHDIVIRMNLGYPYLSKKNKQGQALIPEEWINEVFIDRKTRPSEKHIIVSPEAPEDILRQYTNILHIGKRTDIWSFATTDRRRQKTFSRLFHGAIQLWPHPSLWNLCPKLWNTTIRTDFKYQKRLRKRFKIDPSTGIILFEMIKDLPIQSLDLYGFDFFTSGHIGRKKKQIERFPHNPSFEEKYIKEIVEQRTNIQLRNC